METGATPVLRANQPRKPGSVRLSVQRWLETFDAFRKRLRSVGALRTIGAILAFVPLMPLVITRTTAARLLQLPQRPPQGINLPFVRALLSLGEFGQFQDLLHLVEDALERFDYFGNLFDGLADGRAFHFRFNRPGNVAHFRSHRFKHCRWLGRDRRRRFDRRRRWYRFRTNRCSNR